MTPTAKFRIVRLLSVPALLAIPCILAAIVLGIYGELLQEPMPFLPVAAALSSETLFITSESPLTRPTTFLKAILLFDLLALPVSGLIIFLIKTNT